VWRARTRWTEPLRSANLGRPHGGIAADRRAHASAIFKSKQIPKSIFHARKIDRKRGKY
jgi:hypothetical protein